MQGVPVVLTLFRDEYASFYKPHDSGSIITTKHGAYITTPRSIIHTSKGPLVLTYDLYGITIPHNILKAIKGAKDRGIPDMKILNDLIALKNVRDKILNGEKISDEEKELMKAYGYDEKTITSLSDKIIFSLYDAISFEDLWSFFNKNIDAAAISSLIEQKVAEKVREERKILTFNNVMLFVMLLVGAAVAYVIIKSVAGGGETIVKEVVKTAATNATNILPG